MKLPWDKKYLKISLHIIFTLLVTYILIVCFNSATYVLTNIEGIFDVIRTFFSKFFSVFIVLFIAIIIAYLLDPAVDFFQIKYEYIYERKIFSFLRKNKSYAKLKTFRYNLKNRTSGKDSGSAVKKNEMAKKRTAGTVILYLFMLIVLAILVILLIFALGGKVKDLSEVNIADMFSGWVNETISQLNSFYDSVSDALKKWDVEKYAADFITGIILELTTFLNKFSLNIMSVITSMGSGVANFFLSLVVAFYFLRDKARINGILLDILEFFLPDRLENTIKSALSEIHAVFSGYIRGQLLDGLIMMVLISTALSIIGVDFAVLIGIISGFSNLIPYFGAIVGFILSISVSLLTGNPTQALYAAIAIVVLQQIDGIFIVPRIVGKKVELSPALVLLALAIFGNLFGVVGMIFAVPVTAIIKIFLSRLYARRKRLRKLNEQK